MYISFVAEYTSTQGHYVYESKPGSEFIDEIKNRVFMAQLVRIGICVQREDSYGSHELDSVE